MYMIRYDCSCATRYIWVKKLLSQGCSKNMSNDLKLKIKIILWYIVLYTIIIHPNSNVRLVLIKFYSIDFKKP